MSAKMKFAGSVALAGLIAFAAVPARAADMIESAPEAPVAMDEPVSDWTGAYGGINLGGSFAGHSKDRTVDNSVDTDGLSGSAFGGYQQDLGNGVVLGAEGELGYSGVKGSNAGTKVKTGLEGSLRARAGYAVTPNVLPYVTAGGAARKLKVEQGGESDSTGQLGWTAGGGVDVKLSSNVFARGEYRYTDFGKDDVSVGGDSHEFSTKDHRATVGLGYKF